MTMMNTDAKPYDMVKTTEALQAMEQTIKSAIETCHSVLIQHHTADETQTMLETHLFAARGTIQNYYREDHKEGR